MSLTPLVAESHDALADALEGLTPEQWDAQSLCDLWKVRHVMAHLSMPARITTEEFMAELGRHGGDFTATLNATAARDGELPTAELVSALRTEQQQAWEPPGGGAAGALSHVVIHSLDVTVPLGLPRTSSDAAISAVLDTLTTTNPFGVDEKSYRATDLDWSYGSGEPVEGTAAELVLLLTNR